MTRMNCTALQCISSQNKLFHWKTNIVTIMNEETAVHIGPKINCDDVEIVKNENNFICCKISKKVNPSS